MEKGSDQKMWKSCSRCSIFVCTTDFDFHDKYCTKTKTLLETFNILPHQFIFKEILHTSVGIMNDSTVLLPSYKQSLVLIHPLAMARFGFVKGGYVLVYCAEGQLLLKSWPCSTVKLSSVILPGLAMFQNYIANHAILKKIVGPTDYVKEIILVPKIKKHFMDSKIFRNFVLEQVEKLHVKAGMKLNFICCGYQCEMEVLRIIGMNSNNKHDKMDEISKEMVNLNIGDKTQTNSNQESLNKDNFKSLVSANLSSDDYFKISSNSCITIEEDSEKNHENHSLNVMFKNIGGLFRQISEIKYFMNNFLNHNDIKKIVSMYQKCLLFSGPRGTGKSLVVAAIKNEFGLPLLSVNTSEILNAYETRSEMKLKSIFDKAADRAPSIIFIDNVDSICINKHKNAQIMIDHLSAQIDELQKSSRKVFLIATTNKPDLLDPKLMQHNILGKDIKFDIPSSEERKEILAILLSVRKHTLSEDDIFELSNSMHGFTGADIERLCRKAELLASLRSSSLKGQEFWDIGGINFPDMKQCLKEITPNAVMEFKFEKPQVKWRDIGGMHEVKRAITEMVEWPLKHTEQFMRFKITPSRGILLYGPPGCSKTMIAKALVSESQLNFIPIKGPQLFNKFVGESEKAVSELFKKARAAAPCVIFFDEIDSLASKRGCTTGNSNVADRVLAQLLIEIDGIDVLKGVSIIAATNRPDMIDPSLLRPGRFDRRIYVPLPDLLTRKEIFEVKLSKMPLSEDVYISHLVDATSGYTGAEIDDICREAVYQMSPWQFKDTSNLNLAMEHFEAALKVVTPRTTQDMIVFYENYNTRNAL